MITTLFENCPASIFRVILYCASIYLGEHPGNNAIQNANCKLYVLYEYQLIPTVHPLAGVLGKIDNRNIDMATGIIYNKEH